MKYITLGVIGHVDHGKTSLVRAVTGIDTDRLKEEKERGISIALGFANLRLPGGEMGIVDVPGHEKFIRTMISGATAIEAVLLTVDVNEGVKPQTEEHLAIAGLLGIKRGVVAITKCDAAQPGAREFAVEELREFLAGSFLDGAPIVHTSSQSGEGLEALTQQLAQILDESTPLADEGFAYLPVDRVFSMSGFGTVVTGTLRRGSIHVGDEVEIYPRGLVTNVRELQSHNISTDHAVPGFRTAVNLRGVDKDRVARGDIVATPGSLKRAAVLNADLHVVPSARRPLKHRQVVRLLFGTHETFARLHLVDRNEVAPGESCVLQFRLDEPVAVLNREPFIIRTYSPMTTVGGGIITGTAEKGYRRGDSAAQNRLDAFSHGDTKALVSATVEAAGLRGIDIESLAREQRLTPRAIEAVANSAGVVVCGPRHLVGAIAFETLRRAVADEIESFHAKNPTQRGLPREQLVNLASSAANPVIMEYAIATLQSEGTIAFDGGRVRLAKFTPAGAMSESDRRTAEAIESAFVEGGLTPPELNDIVGNDKDRNRMFRYLVDQGVLVHVPILVKSRPGHMAFHAKAVAETQRILRGAFPPPKRFATSDAKAVLNVSRKYLIPLLEHLDTAKFTRRSGEDRTIIE